VETFPPLQPHARVYVVGGPRDDIRAVAFAITWTHKHVVSGSPGEALEILGRYAEIGWPVFAVVVLPGAQHELDALRPAAARLGARVLVPESPADPEAIANELKLN
jgi:hypothetical protein